MDLQGAGFKGTSLPCFSELLLGLGGAGRSGDRAAPEPAGLRGRGSVVVCWYVLEFGIKQRHCLPVLHSGMLSNTERSHPLCLHSF